MLESTRNEHCKGEKEVERSKISYFFIRFGRDCCDLLLSGRFMASTLSNCLELNQLSSFTYNFFFFSSVKCICVVKNHEEAEQKVPFGAMQHGPWFKKY